MFTISRLGNAPSFMCNTGRHSGDTLHHLPLIGDEFVSPNNVCLVDGVNPIQSPSLYRGLRPYLEKGVSYKRIEEDFRDDGDWLFTPSPCYGVFDDDYQLQQPVLDSKHKSINAVKSDN